MRCASGATWLMPEKSRSRSKHGWVQLLGGKDEAACATFEECLRIHSAVEIRCS